MTDTNNNKLAFDALEVMRKRLLDLTLRNKLINYRHTKQSLRIIDELPNQLVETLLSRSEMTFVAINEPTKQDLIDEGLFEEGTSSNNQLDVIGNTQSRGKYPTAREWAKIKGFNIDYEVPENYSESLEGKHTDKKIQTLLYPHELETVLKKIFQISNSSIAETGTNILFLSFGFLEWKEGGKDSVLAPLFLLPVNIKKGRLNKEKRIYEYTIQFSDESVIPNLSLKEKLRTDFGMELPNLDEETKPEEYFGEVVDLIAGKHEWRVHRYVTLSLLNFSKLMMYLDLNPSNWPGIEGIVGHPIVSRFLGGGVDSESNSESEHFDFGEEHKIDEIDKIHDKYPLVYDADSSQHSAIIDVINGENLVIEGPPGTGKSQTITNLIAAALLQQKKVLFVAEKQAALNVVYDKLNKVDLGVFCLNMHSHRSQKRQILDDIKLRLDKHKLFRAPTELDSEINGYEKSKEKLSKHAELINKKWKNTGKTVHEVLMAATLYRDYLDIDKKHSPGLYTKGLTQEVIGINEDYINIFQKVYKSVIKVKNKTIYDHPWYGVVNHDIQEYQDGGILSTLNEWQASLLKTIDLIEEIENKFNFLGLDFDSLNEKPSILLDLEKISEGSKGADVAYSALPSLVGKNLKNTQSCFNLYNEIIFGYREVTKTIDFKVVKSILKSDDLIEMESHISAYADPGTSLLDLFDSLEKLKSLKAIIADIDKPLDQIRDAVDQKSSKYFLQSRSGLVELRKVIDIVSTLKLPYLKYRDSLFDNNELDDLLPEIRGKLEVLLSQQQSLETVFDIGKLPDEKQLISLSRVLQDESLFKWLKKDWWSARNTVLGYANSENIKFSKAKIALDEAIKFKSNLIAFNFRTETHYADVLGEHISGLDTNLPAIEEMRNWYKKIRDEYGVGFGNKVDLGNSILKFSDDFIHEIHRLGSANATSQIDEVILQLNNLESIFSPFKKFSMSDVALIGDKGVIDNVIDTLGGALLNCNPLIDSNKMSVSELLERVNSLNALNNNIALWEKLDTDIPTLMDGTNPELDFTSNNPKSDIIRSTLKLAEVLDSKIINNEISQYVYKNHSPDNFNELDQYRSVLESSLNNSMVKFNSFKELTMMEISDWMGDAHNSLSNIVERNQKAISGSDSLDGWLDYLRHKQQMSLFGLKMFVDEVVETVDLSTNMVKTYRAIIFDLMARDILSSNSDLNTFSGISQLAIQEKFIKYDVHLKKLQCQKIAWKADQVNIPSGRSSGLVSSFTEGFLIKHEIRKKARHIPIRQLIERSGNALVSLKPCFMMGPMSVAQYLRPGKIKFDLVIMDEASQIKPQDALGAIARGGQAVIVGDPKQLPPTSFFDRNVDGDDEGSQVAIEQQESILDVAAPLFSAKQLRWHYRSKHESLIAFSNQSFYGSNLVVFPSPNSDSKEFGVHLSRVHNGCFVNSRNKEEARIIALAVKEHLFHNSYESIGVVAMNTNQRDQIEREIEVLAKEDKTNVFSRILDKNLNKKHEPLFFKNLENVQGDERDVIFISMTYGPKESGQRVPQRFGPINQAVGWRRLNVLFTRSKKRMHIFSSMDSGDVISDIESGRGIKALHDFLQYCETGSLRMTATDTGSEPDNDFEISIMNMLRDNGYECRPQIGVAGYFIDLGVIDPGKPGRYLMGVECDGATYHSAKSARDRDILRQQVLEGLGWKIRRIWSTDWFKNPHTTLKPILEELALLKTPIVHTEEAIEIEEVDEIEAIIEEVEKHDFLDSEYHNSELDLRKILLKFDSDVIREKYPKTPYSRQLLGPAMLEALIAYTPCDKTEFFELVPLYLRESLNPDEAGDFLERVLDIINFNVN